jgi:hypothetical protein
MPCRFNCPNGHPVCFDFSEPEVLALLRGSTPATEIQIPISCNRCGGDFPMSTRTIEVLRHLIARFDAGSD